MPLVTIENEQLADQLGFDTGSDVETDDFLLAFRLHASRLGTWKDPPEFLSVDTSSRDDWPTNEILRLKEAVPNEAIHFKDFLDKLDGWMWELTKRQQVEAFCHALRYFKSPKLNRRTLDEIVKEFDDV